MYIAYHCKRGDHSKCTHTTYCQCPCQHKRGVARLGCEPQVRARRVRTKPPRIDPET